MIHIRNATIQDENEIREIHRSAFQEEESDLVSELAARLLVEGTMPPTISLIAESDGIPLGHLALSPVSITPTEDIKAYILAPLAVDPNFQKRGAATKLIEIGKQELKQLGVHLLFVYGDPAFYGKFGFKTGEADNYLPQFELQYPFGWQLCVLNECKLSETPLEISCVAPLCDPKLW